jgi:hypothetical protein
MWTGTDDKLSCPDQFESAMWIGKDVKGIFHDKYEVLFELEQMVKDDVMT